MQRAAMLRLVSLLGLSRQVQGTQDNPLSTVLDLFSDLLAKLNKDGEMEAKAYNEYFQWCDEASQNTGYAIETGKKQQAELEAKISKWSSSISVSGAKIDDLAGDIATAQKELADATAIRDKESAGFAANEAELMDIIDTLGRAIGILEKEMAKNPASFAQMQSKDSVKTLEALRAVLEAASFSTQDQTKLSAFIQSQQHDSEGDELMSPPAAAAYKTHSTGILDTLEDMKEKAEGKLSDVRKAEVNTAHNFDMLKQSLEDQISADEKELAEEKSSKASGEEDRAQATGDLSMTLKVLKSSQAELATAKGSCMSVAADHEATVAARQEEIATIKHAQQIVMDTTSGAGSQTYSFVQLASHAGIRTRSDLVNSEIVLKVKQLAKKHHSAALAQLASRIAAVMRLGGEDPFAKVKGLIQDMIAKLEGEASSEATEKAYCDEEIHKTEVKKGELEDDVAKQTSRIDRAAAASAQRKAEVAELQNELSALAKSQAKMDKIRYEGHSDYEIAKADLQLGLTGIRKALQILRDYYGAAAASMLQDDSNFGAFMQQPAKPVTHVQSSGAGGSIINILEVCESDFASNLAKEETEESDAQAEYEKVSQQNAVTKTMKDQDVKYKTQESKALDSTVAEYSGDRDTSSNELSAVLTYYSKIKERCIAKPEKYSERKARRAAEIQGLKEALSILEDETAFVQRRKRGGHFLGL